MSYAYLKHPDGSLEFVEIIMITPADPPPRPHPGPQPPDPNAPRPSHPIALPGDPWWGGDLHPAHPIFLPGMPGWPDNPPGGGEPAKPLVAVVGPMPPGTTPPATPPSDATPLTIWFGKGTKPTIAWVAPYVSTGPVEPPA